MILNLNDFIKSDFDGVEVNWFGSCIPDTWTIKSLSGVSVQINSNPVPIQIVGNPNQIASNSP